MKTGGRPGAAEGGTNPFLRGLTIGVLVGAAIAGSRLWRHLIRRPGPG